MAAPHRPELTTPTPPRFWWLRRGILALVIVGLTLLGVRVWWEGVARARLAAEVAAAHARGEPATAEDFAEPTPSPDDDANAASLIVRAEGQLTYTQAQRDWQNGWDVTAALTAADRTMLRSIVIANGSPLALARRAADVPNVNWGVKVRRPVIAMMYPRLGRRRDLANLLRHSFELAHDTGDDATAIADLRGLLREADAQEVDTPFIITHLVACGIQAAATNVIERSAATLRVDGGPARTAAETLLSQLCDESAVRAGGRRQWYGERLYMVDMADDPATLGLVPSGMAAAAWPVKPMLLIDAADLYRAESAVAAALGQPSWPAARACLPNLTPTAGSGLDSLRTILRQVVSPAFAQPSQSHFHGLNDRRVAAVLLALRLYAADHGERLPDRLAELVPTYLPSVPTDPMSPDGQPLRYVPTVGREAVYSVGEDGVDDGGSTAPAAGMTGAARSFRWSQKDVVVPYHAPPPATQPAA